MTTLAVTSFGATEAPTVLALHGLTGHGRRWSDLADRHLPDLHVVAPDLLGHGHSSWAAPWTIERSVEALVEVLDTWVSGPVVVVGHSYGGALAIHLARAVPQRIRGIVLLDPAIGLDGDRMAEAASSVTDTWYLRDIDDARSRKRAEAWWEVPEYLLEAEIDTHLVPTADGAMTWRLHPGAVTTSWSELARPAVLPPADLPVSMVIADRVSPPYVADHFVDALRAHLGAQLHVHHEDCDHMVPLSRPELTARLIRDMVERTR